MAGSTGRVLQRLQKGSNRSRVDTRQVAQEMCSRSPRSDEEADALLEFNTRFREGGHDWDRRFVHVIVKFLLSRSGASGQLTQENLDWLIERVGPGTRLSNRNIYLLWVRLLEKASSVPEGTGWRMLKALCGRIVLERASHPDVIDLLRRVLVWREVRGTPWIDQAEASLIWRVQDRLEGAEVHPSWNDLFARAIANHLIVRAHPNPESERAALSRRHWLDLNTDNPARNVGSLAVGVDKGDWFGRLNPERSAAEQARAAARSGADRSTPPRRDLFSWWSRTSNAAGPAQGFSSLVDFLNQEAPGLVDGLVIAAR